MCNGIKAKQGGKAIETENGGCFPEEKINEGMQEKKMSEVPNPSSVPLSQEPEPHCSQVYF